ncbi:2-hydroxycarboxylate transporter family protein [Edwardsiella tarda]|nr:2-hydroxycarboxylate transporter family protein [Edwardsiella tarda]
MVATLAFFGFACGEFGKRLPIVGKMGAAAICATFIPSAMVYYGVLPQTVVTSTTQFFKSSNILYLYICCIIVGSIMSMNRSTLIQGFMRIFFPMLCGEIAGMLVGMGVGYALGLAPFQTFFFLILPIMAGGVGEGAIPLSMGYATLLHMQQGVALGRILPIVMLGSLTAIVIAGSLNMLGKRFPHLTGEGELMPRRAGDNATQMAALTDTGSDKLDISALASGALLAVLLYMVGMLGHRLIGLPAPVGMLFVAVLIKLAHGVSPRIMQGSQIVYHFFRTSVTYPILFAVGVAITPWQELVNAFTLANLAVIVSTVVTLVATGFIVGKRIGMHPIDVAIVSCCQSGQGGTGDVAILTAGNRMALMPFAQIATRIGGAINVSLALLFLGKVLL